MQYLQALLIPIFFLAGAWCTLLPHHNERQVLQILRHAHLRIPAGHLVLGYIETAGNAPELSVKRESEITLTGWTVFTQPLDPIQRIDILVDGKCRAQVQDFSSRPYVADAYDRRDFEASGWLASLSLSGIMPGKHVLLVHATSQNGNSGDLPPLILNVQ
jgi:hypothetical protein